MELYTAYVMRIIDSVIHSTTLADSPDTTQRIITQTIAQYNLSSKGRVATGSTFWNKVIKDTERIFKDFEVGGYTREWSKEYNQLEETIHAKVEELRASGERVTNN